MVKTDVNPLHTASANSSLGSNSASQSWSLYCMQYVDYSPRKFNSPFPRSKSLGKKIWPNTWPLNKRSLFSFFTHKSSILRLQEFNTLLVLPTDPLIEHLSLELDTASFSYTLAWSLNTIIFWWDIFSMWPGPTYQHSTVEDLLSACILCIWRTSPLPWKIKKPAFTAHGSTELNLGI